MRAIRRSIATAACAALFLVWAPSIASAATPVCNQSGAVAVWSPEPGETAVIPTSSYPVNSKWVCTLYEGTSGEGVRRLQNALNRCNFQNIAVDGNFGPATKSALIDAQRARGATVDGNYGSNSRVNLYWPTTLGLCKLVRS